MGDEWNLDSTLVAGPPTILMLPGGGQNRFSWKNTGQILADRGFHVIALDARGHGDSDRAPGRGADDSDPVDPGQLSDVVSPEGVWDFLTKVPHARFVELSEAGHTAAGDDNDEFNQAVVDFVSHPRPPLTTPESRLTPS